MMELLSQKQMHMVRLIAAIFLSFISLWSSLPNCQPTKERSLALFKNKKYEDVVSLLNNQRKLIRTDATSAFILGVSYFQINNLNKAEFLMDQLLQKEKNVYPECWWYKGQILHHKHQFKEATTFYKSYLIHQRDNHPNRQMVIDAIRNCANGIQYQYQEGLAEIDNLGNSVNTKHDEFAPIISPNFPDKLYFSSIRPNNMGVKRNTYGQIDEVKGDYLSDIYQAQMNKGRWESVRAMDYLINSAEHDILLDFGSNGQTLFLYKGESVTNGQILIDTFKQKNQRTVTTSPFISPIQADLGDGMLHISRPGLILFSSNRPGGYGGYDIYKISYKQGVWSQPINLGPDINTTYDEITPFLALDGQTIYYSSNNSYLSIGGFDVLKSTYIPDVDRWLDPKNLMAPINSSADDTHFRLNKDGNTAFLCSSRKDGLGKRDLYIAYFKEYLAEMEPNYTFLDEQEEIPPTASNPPKKNQPSPTPPLAEPPLEVPTTVPSNLVAATEETDESAFALSQQMTYAVGEQFNSSPKRQTLQNIAAYLTANPDDKLVISVQGRPGESLFESIYTGEQASQHIINAGVPQSNVFVKAIHTSDQPKITFNVVNQMNMKARGIVSPVNAPLCYKVQVVSVQKEYRADWLSAYSWPMVEKSFDGKYYRYTLGAYSTYREAKQLRDQIRQRKEAPDAYIVPYVHGFRMAKSDLRNLIVEYPDLKNYFSPN